MRTDFDCPAQAGQALGASPDDWQAFAHLGLTPDLLPVISDLSVPISPVSRLLALDGKTPTQIGADGLATGIAAWSQRCTTPAQIARWAADGRHGIGLVGRQVKALDIDIDDLARAAEVRELVAMVAGSLPCRTRPNSGKCLLIFRMSEPMLKSTIKTTHGMIEFLGDRQQFLLAGTHKSGVRYEWLGGLPTVIPELTSAEVDALREGLQAALGLAGGVSTDRRPKATLRARQAADVDDPAVAWLHENWEVTGEHADGMLDVRCPWAVEHTSDTGPSSTTYLPAGVGGEALAGFHCLHAHCSGRTIFDFRRAVGFDDPADVFDVVELTDDQVAEAAAAAIRNAMRPARVAAETQRERAARIGREGDHPTPTQRLMTASEMLEELVFLEEGSRVSWLRAPRVVLPFEEFKRAHAGSLEVAKNAVGRPTKVHRAILWLEHRDRKTVRGQTFAPGRPAFCLSPGGEPAQNLWKPRAAAPPADWQDLAAPFFEHVAYLVPNPAERERFLDWIAHIEQAPGTLPSTHYLLVAKQTGIGRNWLAYAMAPVFAGHTALGFDLGEALRSGFNGALSQTLLAVVDELHEGGPGGPNKPAAEKLKSMLTEATRRINPKYGRQHVEFNCARFLMFSNHEAALPLADNDRRVVVIENPNERRGADYYSRLYAMLDDPDLGAALAEAFRRRDISGFNPGEVAPMTAAKARTIRAGRSEIEQAVRDVAAEWPADCITSSRLTLEVTEALGGRTWNTQGVCVAAGLVKYPGRVKVAGVAAHVWLLRDPRGWSVRPPAAVAAEVRRGEDIANVHEFA